MCVSHHSREWNSVLWCTNMKSWWTWKTYSTSHHIHCIITKKNRPVWFTIFLSSWSYDDALLHFNVSRQFLNFFRRANRAVAIHQYDENAVVYYSNATLLSNHEVLMADGIIRTMVRRSSSKPKPSQRKAKKTTQYYPKFTVADPPQTKWTSTKLFCPFILEMARKFPSPVHTWAAKTTKQRQ